MVSGASGGWCSARFAIRVCWARTSTSSPSTTSSPPTTWRTSLKYDSTQGRFNGTVSSEKSSPSVAEDDTLVVNGHKIKCLAVKEGPAALPWKALGVDIVIESTGLFTEAEKAKGHIDAGAKKVHHLRSRQGRGHHDRAWASTTTKYDPAKHHIISNASCTTNCLAPVVHVLLKEGFGVEEGLMTTIHSYTATQKTVDGPSKKDWKGGRTAAINIIPSTTGAAKAVGLAIPEVKGKLTGMSFRVPTPTVSRRRSDRQDGEGDQLQGNQRGDEEGQRDVPQGHPGLHRGRGGFVATSSTTRTRAFSTRARGIELNSRFFKLVSWYDNEWGYSNRCVDLIRYMAK